MHLPSFPASAPPGGELNAGTWQPGHEDPSPRGALAGGGPQSCILPRSGLGAGGEAPCSKTQRIHGKFEV